MLKLPEKLENKLSDWGINYDYDSETIEFIQHSPSGQDFGFEVYTGNDLDDLCENIAEYIEDYDPSEEASLWLNSSGHGINGAPYEMGDVYEDMVACQSMMEELQKDIQSYSDSYGCHYYCDSGIRKTWELEDLLDRITDILESCPSTSLRSPEEAPMYEMMENLKTYMENNI